MTSAPTRKASSGIEPPPAKGSTTSGRVPGFAAQRLVRCLGQRAAGVEILLDGRVVPVGKVGDEVEQGKAKDVPMRLVVAVESAIPGHRLPFDPRFVVAARAQFLAVRRRRGKVIDDL